MEFNNKCFMFFWNLPISIPCLKNDLPITSHVSANTSTSEVIHYLQSIDSNIAHACYPQYGISGYRGCHHRIFFSNLESIDFLQVRKEMWEALGLLRLVKPLPLHIAGTVEIRDNDIYGFETVWHKTILNIGHNNFNEQNLEYSKNDISFVQNLWQSLFQTNRKETRILKAIHSFIRASLTEQISYSETFYQKLFPILDLLMGNPCRGHCQQLTNTIGPWLQHVYASEADKNKIDFTMILQNLWDNYRHNYLHLSASLLPPSHLYSFTENGNYIYTGGNQNEDNRQGAYTLHEIVRLTIMSLLYLPINEQEAFCNIPLVENHKKQNERKDSDKKRIENFKNYYQKLIKNKINPSKIFWIENWHNNVFGHYC